MKIYVTDEINSKLWFYHTHFNNAMHPKHLSLEISIKFELIKYKNLNVDFYELEIDELDNKRIISISKIDKKVINKLAILL